MKIIISNNSYTPIFEQVKHEITEQILSGALAENEPLPSIRSLAQDLRISVMTVKKAYDQLEQEGYIVTKQGKGSFVAPRNIEMVKEETQKEIENHIVQIIDLAKRCDLKKEEIIDIFEFLYGGRAE